ncbi:lactonase family protein [Bacillus sp. UMB0893]|uniref:lactonase family protein n=1 Tax=Bacillus sp. UMB0893 TaxID=2066053 RepID=UPI000C761A0A|nr:lactonase family protein [Bacillus sp. UMB0893]PLR69223.1 6-phosphogluconolactonase [Bacillus sp. UMB0893]
MKFTGYIGTYTKGDSKGIYTFTLDAEAKKLSEASVAAALDNPTYLTISKDNRFVYAVAKEGEAGGVAAFSRDEETGDLRELNRQLLQGASPCHVSVDSENHFIVSANYHNGTIESYEMNAESETLYPALSIKKHEGSGPNKDRQDGPHAHYAGFTPDQKYVAAIDLGTDKLYTYKLNNGELNEIHSLHLHAGSGPRHLTFHPNGKVAYVMTELSNEVVVLDYNEEDGSFTEKQYISTIPDDFTENNQGSAIHISSDGRFVYAANRGHDSIAIFSVNQDNGELTFVDRTSTEGNWPRDFVLDPTETFLIATNQESSNLVLFERNPETGTLKLLQSDVKVPDPVCVKFLNV